MDAYIVKGTALANMDKMSDAIKTLNDAVVRCGDEYFSYFQLRIFHFNSKDNKMAAHHLRKAIEIDATHSSAFLLYAYALNDLDQWVQSFLCIPFLFIVGAQYRKIRRCFRLRIFGYIRCQTRPGSVRLTPEDGMIGNGCIRIYN